MIIKHMNDFDWSDLDARLLQLLVAVVEAGSITGAAQSLGVTQSAVSHQLDKLRAITGDALFVKSGRGIVATARAGELAVQARELLRQLQGFAHTGAFDPARGQRTITIAANDFQRDVLLPALARVLREQAPGVALRVIPSDIPSLEMLRDGVCDIAISPRPPEGSDIVQKRIFEDRYCVYFDAAVREAPALLHDSFMREFARAEVPTPCPSLPMYMIWHRRHQDDAAHRWLRERLHAPGPGAPRRSGRPRGPRPPPPPPAPRWLRERLDALAPGATR